MASESTTNYQDPGLLDDEALSNLLSVSAVQAVFRAASSLEIAVRNLAGDVGIEKADDPDWIAIAEELVRRGFMPRETLQALKEVVGLRNRVVHGPGSDARESTLVVEGAIEVIRAIRETPREVHRVCRLIDVYPDRNVTSAYRAVQGLML